MSAGEPQPANQIASRSRGPRWPALLERYALFALPVLTVVVITFAVFVVGVPRSYQAARIWGGPTQDGQPFTARLQAVERYHEVERALGNVPVDVQALVGADVVARFSGRTDAAGFLDFSLPARASHDGKVRLQALQGKTVLVAGTASLSTKVWQGRARKRGGWVSGRRDGPLEIRVRGERGVFAVPFHDRVLVEVSDPNGPVAGAAVLLRFEGVSLPSAEQHLTSDERGLVAQLIAPREHVVSLTVEASHEDRSQKWHSTLPVVPGAMHAVLEGRQLHISSAIPRESAFFTVVNQQSRLIGGHLRLASDGRGGAVGQVSLPRLEAPLWCVVSSEPDLQSVAAVGWPLFPEASDKTFDAQELLLADGLPAAYAKSLERPRRARWLAAVFAGLALLLTLLLISRRVRRADATLSAHLERAGGDPQLLKLKALALNLLIVAVVVTLGFLIVVLVTLARID